MGSQMNFQNPYLQQRSGLQNLGDVAVDFFGGAYNAHLQNPNAGGTGIAGLLNVVQQKRSRDAQRYQAYLNEIERINKEQALNRTLGDRQTFAREYMPNLMEKGYTGQEAIPSEAWTMKGNIDFNDGVQATPGFENIHMGAAPAAQSQQFFGKLQDRRFAEMDADATAAQYDQRFNEGFNQGPLPTGQPPQTQAQAAANIPRPAAQPGQGQLGAIDPNTGPLTFQAGAQADNVLPMRPMENISGIPNYSVLNERTNSGITARRDSQTDARGVEGNRIDALEEKHDFEIAKKKLALYARQLGIMASRISMPQLIHQAYNTWVTDPKTGQKVRFLSDKEYKQALTRPGILGIINEAGGINAGGAPLEQDDGGI